MYNYDPAELHKFANLASQWWDTSGPVKPLHDINPIRLAFIESQYDLTAQKVLDVGCGGGILAESMATKGAKVTGIDLSPQIIQAAKLHLYESKLQIDYQQITTTELLQTDTPQFDALTCMELLEHVPNPAELMQDCSKLVKPGGDLFFSTINRNFKAYAFAIIGAEYVLQLLEKGTHDYQRFIKPSELDAWARQAGLYIQHIKGMAYNPFSQTYHLTDDVDVNYLVHYQKEV